MNMIRGSFSPHSFRSLNMLFQELRYDIGNDDNNNNYGKKESAKMWVDLNDNDNGKKIPTVITNECYIAHLKRVNGTVEVKIAYHLA